VPNPAALLYVLIGVTIVLVATIAFRPSLTATRGGKQLEGRLRISGILIALGPLVEALSLVRIHPLPPWGLCSSAELFF